MSTILLLDDEHSILTLVTRILEPMGHSVLQASNGADAFARFDESDGGIDLMIADVSLPETSGVAVAFELRSLLPNLRIIFTSGKTPDLWSDQDIALLNELPSEGVFVLAKPFGARDLQRVVANFAGGPPRPALAPAAANVFGSGAC